VTSLKESLIRDVQQFHQYIVCLPLPDQTHVLFMFYFGN